MATLCVDDQAKAIEAALGKHLWTSWGSSDYAGTPNKCGLSTTNMGRLLSTDAVGRFGGGGLMGGEGFVLSVPRFTLEKETCTLGTSPTSIVEVLATPAPAPTATSAPVLSTRPTQPPPQLPPLLSTNVCRPPPGLVGIEASTKGDASASEVPPVVLPTAVTTPRGGHVLRLPGTPAPPEPPGQWPVLLGSPLNYSSNAANNTLGGPPGLWPAGQCESTADDAQVKEGLHLTSFGDFPNPEAKLGMSTNPFGMDFENPEVSALMAVSVL